MWSCNPDNLIALESVWIWSQLKAFWLSSWTGLYWLSGLAIWPIKRMMSWWSLYNLAFCKDLVFVTVTGSECNQNCSYFFLFWPLFITIHSLHDQSVSSQWWFMAIWITSCIYLALNLGKYCPNCSCKSKSLKHIYFFNFLLPHRGSIIDKS